MKIFKQVGHYLISNAMASFALLTLLYIFLILVLPANPRTMQAYDLSAFEYRSILLAITLPSLLVWLAAFIGYDKLWHYARSVQKTSEGKHFSLLAKGATWLAWSLPITALVSFILSATSGQNQELLTAAIVISNYLTIILPLVAFTLIGAAAKALVSDAKLNLSLLGGRTIMLGFVTAGVFYCYLVFKRLDLSSLTAANNAYHLPIWLIVLTVIVPSLYTWFVGTLAAYEIQLFSRQSPGILYRRALRLLVTGIILIIAGSIALQYINGVEPRTGYLLINFKLMLILTFRLVEGVGFALLAIGANRLRKIEEI